MNFNQLRYFQQIARTGSIHAASDELFVSQSALSKSLHELEAELGCELFDRNGKHIILNDNGKYVLEQADQIIGQVDAIKPHLDIISRNNDHLVLDTFYDFAFDVMYSIASQYFPGVHCENRRTFKPPASFVQDLGSGDLDVAIVPFSGHQYQKLAPLMKENNVDSMYLYHEVMFISAPRRAPYINMESCTPEQVSKMRLVRNTIPNSFEDWLVDICSARRIPFEYMQVINTATFRKVWVDIDLCFVTSSMFFSLNEFYERFGRRHQIRVDDQMASREVFLLFNRDHNTPTSIFLEHFKESFFALFDHEDSG